MSCFTNEWSRLGMAVALVGLGCGGSTIVDGSGGAGGATSTTVGVGGNGGSSSSAVTTGGGESCDILNQPCGPGFYCDSPDADCFGTGTCKPQPEGCPADCPGVCGCDGAFYCNACGAQEAGIDVGDNALTCQEEDVVYYAAAYPGGLDHLFIGKANYADNRCVMLHFAAPMMPSPEYAVKAPEPWALLDITASNSASDCEIPGMMSGTVYADAAMGEANWDVGPGMIYPCKVDLEAQVTFNNPPAWLPANVTLFGSAQVDGC